MKLYGPVFSQNVFRPLLVAKHLGIELELVPVAMREGAHKGPEFRCVNPFGRIPALSDGEFCLFESVAISQYIAGSTPNALWPEDARARAQITAWMVWGVTHLTRGIGPVQYNRLVKRLFGMGEPDESEIAAGTAAFNAEVAVLEDWLQTRDWLVGGALSLADLDVAGMFLHCDKIGLELGPKGTAWLERVKALPAWGAAATHI